MSRYLFTVWPYSGHVHPSLAIAHALRSRGHEVAFYTGNSACAAIEEEGFKAFRFVKLSEDRTNELVSSNFSYKSSAIDQLRGARQLQANFRQWLLETIPDQVADIEELVQQWRPDVLMCDLAFWGPILVLRETLRIPIAVLSVAAACMLPGPDAPAWGRGLPKPRNWFMRQRSALQRKLVDFLARGFRKRADAIRASYGLPALTCSVTEFAGQMSLYIMPSTPEYDYQRRDLPGSVQYVGPCLWDKPNNTPPPEWLSELPENQPLIYVTEATVGNSDPFLLRMAAQALKNLPMQVVMTTGKQRNLAGMDSVSAPNIRVESYVPQSDILPRTSAMVTIGGSGGVLAALQEGIPLVVVPTEWDRPENAQRVVESGAGLRIDPKRCTPERLRTAVHRVLTEASFRKNARRLANAFAHYGGPIQAAQALELLTSREPMMPLAARGGAY